MIFKKSKPQKNLTLHLISITPSNLHPNTVTRTTNLDQSLSRSNQHQQQQSRTKSDVSIGNVTTTDTDTTTTTDIAVMSSSLDIAGGDKPVTSLRRVRRRRRQLPPQRQIDNESKLLSSSTVVGKQEAAPLNGCPVLHYDGNWRNWIATTELVTPPTTNHGHKEVIAM